MVMMAWQRGHRTPDRLIVPAPTRRSCSRRRAGLPSPRGTSASTPNTTPVLSAFAVIVRRTRFAPFFASQRVLSSGTVARHPLQRAVRAQRYATARFTTQRGFRGSFRYTASNSAFSGLTSVSPFASAASSVDGRGSNVRPPGLNAWNVA